MPITTGGGTVVPLKGTSRRANRTRRGQARAPGGVAAKPTPAQRAWLARGLDQPGGKLPLFDELGARVGARTVRSCLSRGWAEPWFDNPLKPDWLVCRLTEKGQRALTGRGHGIPD